MRRLSTALPKPALAWIGVAMGRLVHSDMRHRHHRDGYWLTTSALHTSNTIHADRPTSAVAATGGERAPWNTGERLSAGVAESVMTRVGDERWSTGRRRGRWWWWRIRMTLSLGVRELLLVGCRRGRM